MNSPTVSKQWFRISSLWRQRYRSWFSAVAMVIATLVVARQVYGAAPWSDHTTLIIVAVIGMLSWYAPVTGIFVALLLLVPLLAGTSIWLAVLQLAVALSFLFLGRSETSQKHQGFLLPLVLVAPWVAMHGLVWLPLLVAIRLYGRQAVPFAVLLGFHTALWAAVQASLPGFTQGLSLHATTGLGEISSWWKLFSGPAHSFRGEFGDWLGINAGPGLVLVLIMFLIAISMVRLRTANGLSTKARRGLSWAAGTLVGAVGLVYLGQAPLDWAGLQAPLEVAAGSALLAWLVTRVLEAPQRSVLQRKEVHRQTRWTDIAGYEDVKKEVLAAVEPYMDPAVRERLNKLKLPAAKGILLYGPPGVGKTMFARAVAAETGMKFIAVAGPEFICTWVGESERRLRAIFEEAKESAPCVIFFDEIESFLQPRTATPSSTADLNQRVVATFLSHMDGFEPLEGVLVIGATNRPDQIDPAAIRPGRFDKIIFVPPPAPDARRAIWEHFLAGRPGGAQADLDALVKTTERHTGADIEAIANECYRSSAGGMVTTQTLLDLISQTKPSVSLTMLETYEELSRTFGRRAHTLEKVPLRESVVLTWDDIAGMEGVKEQLRGIVEFPMTHAELFEQYRLRPARGVLLYGPPGCGKTLFARVLASETKATFLSVNGPEFLRGTVGESEQRVRQLFREARESRPAVIFIDEVDALAPKRDDRQPGLQVVNQLLTEMDGMDELLGVVVVAATNRPDVLDPALLRPGRFDRLVYIGLPDDDSRWAQLEYHLKGRPAVVDLNTIVKLSAGCTGAELAYAVNEAALCAVCAAVDGNARPITTEDLRQVLAQMPRSISRTDQLQYDLQAGLQR